MNKYFILPDEVELEEEFPINEEREHAMERRFRTDKINRRKYGTNHPSRSLVILMKKCNKTSREARLMLTERKRRMAICRQCSRETM